MKSIKELLGLSEEAKAKKMKGDDPCWDSHEMVGMKKGKGGKPVPNCVPKNEEVEIAEAKVGDTVSFHHELQSAPGTKVKKSGTVEKVEGGVVHVKVKDKYGVKRHQVKMGDLVKEDTELEEASDTKRPPNFTMYPIDRQDYKILRKPKKALPKSGKEWGRDAGEKKIKEDTELEEQHSVLFKMKKNDPKIAVAHYKSKEDAHKFLQSVKDKGGNGIIRSKTNEDTEQIDELNKDTVYSYNNRADADIEKKHKSLGQLMRKGDAAGANKASHQINRRLAGMERAEKRLNKEEVEVEESKKNPASDKPVDPKDLVVSLKDVPVKKPRGHKQYDPSKEFPGVKALKREEVDIAEGLLDAAKSAVKTGAKHVAGAAKSAAVGFVHGAIDASTSDSAVLKHVGKKLHNVVKKKFGEEVELDEAVEVRHDRYQRSHGKNASGTGDWMFTHKSSGQVNYSNDKEIHRARGSFSDAAKSAKAWAKSHGHTSVYVMEQTGLSNKFLSDYKASAGKQASELDKQGTKKATIKANKRFRGINRATEKQFANDAKSRNEEVKLDESTKLLAKHGDVEVHSMGSSVLSVLKKGKEIAQGDYDRHADTYWISHPSFGKGDKAFDTTMDVAKHFSSVKEEVDLDEEAPPIHVRSSYTQAYAKHHKTGKKPSDAVAAAYEDVAKKHGYDMVKKLKAHHAANEQVETAAQVTKHFEKGQSTSTGVPKWVAKVVKAKKKLQQEQADAELMGAQPSGNKKLAAKFEKSFKAMGQPRKVNCMTVGQVSSCEDTEHEFNAMFTEAMKKKPEASSKQTLKKGEKLSGKQEPVTISPEIEKKGVA